jgi:hypothetical protein
MNYITQIEAVDLCRQLRIEFSTDDIVEDNQIESVHELCNAAIQHYIETSVSELTGTAYTVPALVQPAKPVEPAQVIMDVTIEGEAAKVLRDYLVQEGEDEPSSIRLLLGDGHSGHGLYLAAAEYPEEGAILLAAAAKERT